MVKAADGIFMPTTTFDGSATRSGVMDRVRLALSKLAPRRRLDLSRCERGEAGGAIMVSLPARQAERPRSISETMHVDSSDFEAGSADAPPTPESMDLPAVAIPVRLVSVTIDDVDGGGSVSRAVLAVEPARQTTAGSRPSTEALRDSASGLAVKSATEHATALLQRLQEDAATVGVVAYEVIADVYTDLLIERQWAPRAWKKVSCELRRLTGGRKRYVNRNGRKVLVFDIPDGCLDEIVGSYVDQLVEAQAGRRAA